MAAPVHSGQAMFKLRASIILPIVQIVFNDITGAKQNLREAAKPIFSFGAVKLLLDLRNISLFPHLSLARQFAKAFFSVYIC